MSHGVWDPLARTISTGGNDRPWRPRVKQTKDIGLSGSSHCDRPGLRRYAIAEAPLEAITQSR